MRQKKSLMIISLLSCAFVSGGVGAVIAKAEPNNWLEFRYESMQTEGYLGESVELAEIAPVYPNKVAKTYFHIEAPDGKTVENDGDTFALMQTGDYRVYVCMVGTNGETYAESYVVSSSKSSAPILSVEPAIPVAFLEGETYELPKAVFTDYNTAMPTETAYAVYLSGENGDVLLSQDFQPTATVHGTEIILKYVAQSVETKENKTVEYSVPVLKAFDLDEYGDRKYAYEKMFATESVERAELTEIGATFYANQDFSLAYANGVQDSFSINVKSMQSYSNFESLIFTFTDSKNKKERVDLEISALDDVNSTLILPNGKKYKFGGSIEDFSKGLQLSFDKRTLSLLDVEQKEICRIGETSYGKNFNGFSSKRVNFEIQVKGVKSLSALAVYSLNGHTLSLGNEYDYILPFVEPLTDLSVTNSLNTTAVLSEAIAYDVLDPSVKPVVSVYSPDGNIVTAKDGTKLSKAPADKNYELILSKLGEYSIQYEATDANGNLYGNGYYTMYAIDSVAPTLKLSENIKSEVSLGGSLTIPNVECSDDISSADKLQIWVSITKPNGRYDFVEVNSKYKFEEKGTYYIYFSAMDENYNVTTFVKTVVCK